ncbi:MFS transporter [Actinoplanes sp. NBC_00393]|uniref:MFS transporter n=1 Tax=Actinoplanes sp. NBC_00393 TaxID=2975953 RepID=UPI002E1B6710
MPRQHSSEIRAVNLAGLVQGITLVTFPAASSIFTNPDQYDLSSSQYGAMFLPQVLTAIATTLLGAGLARRLTPKRVLLLGLTANLTAMVVLVLSAGVKADAAIAYPLLLVATAFLGAGFGLTVPVLNTYVAASQPARADKAVLVLNALLGLGTALAPVFVAIFVGLGFWWGLPVLSAALLLLLLLACARLPLRAETGTATGPARRAGIPSRFLLFAGFAVLYGICETVNGNWSQAYMTTDLGASTTQAALALTAFWAMVTVGRVLFAAIVRTLPPRAVFRLLPIILMATFALTAALPQDAPWFGVATFALAGLGCSALLPLTISLGQDELTAMSTVVAGGVIAFYQVGYGIAAFGVDPLVDNGVSLPDVYGGAAIAALVLTALSFAVTRRQMASVAS